MNITIERGFDLRIGNGAHRLRFAFYGWNAFLFRVPFIGKAWSFGSAGGGCIGWAEAKREASVYGDD